MLPSATLAEFYRFALLLTGNIATAERVMAETLAEGEKQIGDMRDEMGRQAWMAAHLRNRCIHDHHVIPETPRLVRQEVDPGETPEVLQIEAFIVAQRFHTLPEPERSALALFYLNLFTPEEIGRLLGMRLELLADTLTRGRSLLREALRELRSGG